VRLLAWVQTPEPKLTYHRNDDCLSEEVADKQMNQKKEDITQDGQKDRDGGASVSHDAGAVDWLADFLASPNISEPQRAFVKNLYAACPHADIGVDMTTSVPMLCPLSSHICREQYPTCAVCTHEMNQTPSLVRQFEC